MTRLKYKRWTSPVPPMTHELGSSWKQPDSNLWDFDDTHVIMPEADLKKLCNYSASYPTGVYAGKMWRAQDKWGEWYLMWYGDVVSDLVPIQLRRILFA